MERRLCMDNVCVIPNELYPSTGDRESDIDEKNTRITLWNLAVIEFNNMLKSLNKLERVDRQTLERLITLRLGVARIIKLFLSTLTNFPPMKGIEDIISTKLNISRLEADLRSERAKLVYKSPLKSIPVPPPSVQSRKIWSGRCTICNEPCMHLDASQYNGTEVKEYVQANAKKECNSRYILCNHPISAHEFTLVPYSSTLFFIKDNNTGLRELGNIQKERDIIERIDRISQDIRASKRILADMGADTAAVLIKIYSLNRQIMEYTGDHFCDRFVIELERRIDAPPTGEASWYYSLLKYYQSIQSSTLLSSIHSDHTMRLLSSDTTITYNCPEESLLEQSMKGSNEYMGISESMRSTASSSKFIQEVKLEGLKQVNDFLEKYSLDGL